MYKGLEQDILKQGYLRRVESSYKAETQQMEQDCAVLCNVLCYLTDSEVKYQVIHLNNLVMLHIKCHPLKN